MSPPSRIAMASPIAGLPLTRNIGCGGSAKPRRTVGDVAAADHPAADAKLTPSMSCSESNAPETRSEDALVAGLHHARRAHDVLRLQRAISAV